MEKMGVEGSFVGLITLLNSDGTVDFDGFRTRIDLQASNGTNALLVMGSTGEVSMLSQKERERIISETLKFKKGDILFFYGCTGTSTQDTIHQVRYAAKEGAVISKPWKSFFLQNNSPCRYYKGDEYGDLNTFY